MSAAFEIQQKLSAPKVFTDCYRGRPELDQGVFRKELKSCQVFVMRLDGATIGAIACKNGYFHLGVLPQFRRRWATRARLRHIANWAKSHGCTLTKAGTGSFGERMAKAAGMTPLKSLQGGTEYAYAP